MREKEMLTELLSMCSIMDISKATQIGKATLQDIVDEKKELSSRMAHEIKTFYDLKKRVEAHKNWSSKWTKPKSTT